MCAGSVSAPLPYMRFHPRLAMALSPLVLGRILLPGPASVSAFEHGRDPQSKGRDKWRRRIEFSTASSVAGSLLRSRPTSQFAPKHRARVKTVAEVGRGSVSVQCPFFVIRKREGGAKLIFARWIGWVASLRRWLAPCHLPPSLGNRQAMRGRALWPSGAWRGGEGACPLRHRGNRQCRHQTAPGRRGRCISLAEAGEAVSE